MDQQPKQRQTRQRALVLDVVRSHMDHPTAEQVYRDVHERDEKVGRATVYRNLNLLGENGEVMQVDAPYANRYDYRTDPHYHMVCTRCGKVSDAPLEYQRRYDAMVAEMSGFTVTGHQTMFEGLCPACQAELAHQETDGPT